MGRFSSFLQDWANCWQTDLFWHEKHCSVIVSCPWKTDFFHTLFLKNEVQIKKTITDQCLNSCQTNLSAKNLLDLAKHENRPKKWYTCMPFCTKSFNFCHSYVWDQQLITPTNMGKFALITCMASWRWSSVVCKVDVIHFRLWARWITSYCSMGEALQKFVEGYMGSWQE